MISISACNHVTALCCLSTHSQTATEGVTKKDKTKHARGCNCSKSRCVKNYCECWQMDIKCTDKCKCVNCANGKPGGGDDSRQDMPMRSSTSTVGGATPLLSHMPQVPQMLPMPPMHEHVLESPASLMGGSSTITIGDFQLDGLLGHEQSPDEMHSPIRERVLASKLPADVEHMVPARNAYIEPSLPPNSATGATGIGGLPGSGGRTPVEARPGVTGDGLECHEELGGLGSLPFHLEDTPKGCLTDLLESRSEDDKFISAGLKARKPPLMVPDGGTHAKAPEGCDDFPEVGPFSVQVSCKESELD